MSLSTPPLMYWIRKAPSSLHGISFGWHFLRPRYDMLNGCPSRSVVTHSARILTPTLGLCLCGNHARCSRDKPQLPILGIASNRHMMSNLRFWRCRTLTCGYQTAPSSVSKRTKFPSCARQTSCHFLTAMVKFHTCPSSGMTGGKKPELKEQNKGDTVHVVPEAWESLLGNDDKKSNIASIPTKRENIFTIPNLLSFSRILATPYISYLVLSERFSLALALFLAAGITDVLDGQIARRWPSQKSAFGTALDPLGDKILVTVMTITLTASGIIPWPLTAIIVGRDALLMMSVFYLRYRTCPPPLTIKRYFDPTLVNTKLNPTTISKANTVLQMAVIWLSMCAPVWEFTGHPLLNSLYLVTGITTAWSGLSYIYKKDTIQILKDK